MKFIRKRISIIVNVYIDTQYGKENPYDHPTDFYGFEQKNTFREFYESVCRLKIPDGHELDLIVFAIAANNDSTKDLAIKGKINTLVQAKNLTTYVITNSEIELLRKKGHSFLSTVGYCEIRNLGFVFGFFNNSDFIIQFDDDEIIPQNYLVKMVELYDKYPGMCSLNSFYEKDGQVNVDDSGDFKCWSKLNFMNQDFNRLSDCSDPKESIFGLGGNMTFRREYYSKLCYPENVRRGEDFALMLAGRLIYENGNDKCCISPSVKSFISYFTADKDMIIAHRPPAGHRKKHRLKNDFVRFIRQRALLGNNMSFDKLYELSRYMWGMLVVDDYFQLVENVYREAAEYEPELYTDDFIKSEVKDIIDFQNELNKRNLFEEYKEYQKKYIDLLASASAEIEIGNLLHRCIQK